MRVQHLVRVTLLAMAVAGPWRCEAAFELLDAHGYGRTQEVVLRFSQPVEAREATNTANYRLGGGLVPTRAALVEPWTEMVVLKFPAGVPSTGAEIEVSGLRSLTADLLDPPARATVQGRPALPDDSGAVVHGFQDDFVGPRRDPRWVPRGGSDNPAARGEDLFVVTNGVLLVQPGRPSYGQSTARLLFEHESYDRAVQEVLLRIRAWAHSNNAQEWCGPVAACGFQPAWPGLDADYRGLGYAFQADRYYPARGLNLEGLLTWHGAQLMVQTQRWYWVRMRHVPDATPGSPDAFARIWPADGTVPEPVTWASWDYASRLPRDVRIEGAAGIASANPAAALGYGGYYVVDYFLLKAAGLPEITVAPGALQAPLISAAPSDEQVLAGAPLRLTFGVNAEPPYGLHWYRDGVRVGTGTNTTFEIPASTPAVAGEYRLVATNAFGNTTSAPVRVDVVGEVLFADAVFPGTQAGWSHRTTSFGANGRAFLGEFLDETVTFTVTNAPASGQALLTAELVILDDWDGADIGWGADVWQARVVGGPVLLRTTFNNQKLPGFWPSDSLLQHYPHGEGGELELPLTGASEASFPASSLDSEGHAIYPLRLLVPLGQVPLVVELQAATRGRFDSFNTQSKWGVDNVALTRLPEAAAWVRLRDPILHVSEASEGILLTLERGGELTIPARVGVRAIPLQAVPGRDFHGSEWEVVFPPGSPEQRLLVPLGSQPGAEPARRLRFELFEPGPDVVLADTIQTLVVIHDSANRTWIEPPPFGVFEGAAEATFELRRDGDVSEPAIVRVVAGPGPEADLADVVPQTNTVVFAAGWTAPVTLRVLDDVWDEPDERFTVRLLADPRSGVGEQEPLLVPIRDDDSALQAGMAVDGPVRWIVPLPDGGFCLAGDFTRVHGQPRPGLARCLPSGRVDPGFVPGLAVSSRVRPCVLADGSMICGMGSPGSAAGEVTRLVKLDVTGSPEPGFAAEFDQGVAVVALRSDGRIAVGGGFGLVNGVRRARIAVLTPDGAVDPSFDPGEGFSGPVQEILPQPGGRLIVHAPYARYRGTETHSLVRVLEDGSPDPEFQWPQGVPAKWLATAGQARHLAGLADGPLWLDKLAPGGLEVLSLTRDGVLAPGFVGGTGPRWSPEAVLPLPDGGALMFGAPGSTVPAPALGYRADGTRDSSFLTVRTDGAVSAAAILADGHLVVGGTFTHWNGSSRVRLARLKPDGTEVPWPAEEPGPIGGLCATNRYWFDDQPGVLEACSASAGAWSALWSFEGGLLPGETNLTLRLDAVSAADSGDYQALIRGETAHWLGAPTRVTVLPASARPRLQGPGLLGADRVNLTLNTVPGLSYAIESTVDLRAWAAETNFTATWEQRTISLQRSEATRFYRAVLW